jgi:hypothetical protein
MKGGEKSEEGFQTAGENNTSEREGSASWR